MQKTLSRLLTAGLLSAVCFAITFYWYRYTDPKRNESSHAETIAFVKKPTDEIHRRSATRIMWQLVDEGEPLRAGDAVKTSVRGEVRIQFSDSERYLDLEPDSLIVLQKTKGEISLDLLEGSLFVNAAANSEKGSPALTLKSAQGSVDISKATVQLSGSSAKNLDVKVLKGEANIKSQDGKVETIQSGKTGGINLAGTQFRPEELKILSPSAEIPYYINPDEPKPLSFKWQGLPANTKVQLEVGSSRKKLSPIPTQKLGPQELSAAIKPGKFYWQLKALNPTTNETVARSSIYRSEVISVYPPAIISPEHNAKLQIQGNTSDVVFRWSREAVYSSITLEVARDEKFKNKILTQNFTAESQHTLSNLALGKYHWRLIGFTAQGQQPMVSPNHTFTIEKWERVRVAIQWDKVPETQKQIYANEPTLKLFWNSDQSDKVAKWRVKLSPSENTDAAMESFSVDLPQVEKKLSKPGRYVASVEALNAEEVVIGTSPERTIVVEEMPFLSAPQIEPAGSQKIQAQADGSAQITWSKPSGAQKYKLIISKADGEALLEEILENNSKSLKNLMPGPYTVKVYAVDSFGRLSIEPIEKELVVPDKSQIKAPTLKRVKVN